MTDTRRRTGTWVLAATLGLLAVVQADAGVLATPGGIRFTYDDPNAKELFLAGSLNDWNAKANPMVREEGGVWSTVVRLAAGTYEYKFVVDGQWVADPDNSVTIGDYGNSGLTLGEDGRIVELEATSNTPYSAKILITGRTIATFKSREVPENGSRYEMRRPSFDTDLEFGIRMNDALSARILTNINNESENIEQWRTRLNFDRGHLRFDTGDLEGLIWDNDAIGTWDDPLRLVGAVGIYDHPYGLGTQGAMFRRDVGPFDTKVLYADDFRDGGYDPPRIDVESFVMTPLSIELVDGIFRPVGGRFTGLAFTPTGNNQDVLALRSTTSVGDLQVGFSGRLNRGYNPATMAIVDAFEPDTLTVIGDFNGDGTDQTVDVPGMTMRGRFWNGNGTEESQAAGVDVVVPKSRLGFAEMSFEALWGRARLAARGGTESYSFFGTILDSTVSTDSIVSVSLGGSRDGDPNDLSVEIPINDAIFDLDESWRFHFGLGDLPSFLGIHSSATLQIERHTQDPLTTGLTDEITNHVNVWTVDLDRAGRVHDREWQAALGFAYHDFDYEQDTPWDHQFWFAHRNFWLEPNEHEVAYDRLTLLGGDDAVFWRPSFDLEIWPAKEITFAYDGTFAAIGVDREPKYSETLLQVGWRVSRSWRFLTDWRFVKYNDPVMDLGGSYHESFWEFTYEVAEDVELALSYGVDPWILDEPLNEFAYIGRDMFLFDRGANAGTARTAFANLGKRIEEAETALADERVFQIEAIMRF